MAISASDGGSGKGLHSMATLRAVGFHKKWDYNGSTAAPEAAALSVLVVPPEDYAPPTLSHCIDVSYLRGTTVRIPRKVKSVRLTDCSELLLVVEVGVVASVELFRCRRVTVRLVGGASSLSYLRLDDCSEALVALTALPADGLRVVHSGCHAIKLSCPSGTHSLPDTLCSTLGAAPAAPTTSVLCVGSGPGGFGSLLSPPAPPAPPQANSFKVLIIGAGVSGLALAAALPPHVPVCILEARSRVGGRVCGGVVGGLPVDLGAAWLHGGVGVGGGGAACAHPALSHGLGGGASGSGSGSGSGSRAFPGPGNPWLRAPARCIMYCLGATQEAGSEREDEAWEALLGGTASLACTLCWQCGRGSAPEVDPVGGGGVGGAGALVCGGGGVLCRACSSSSSPAAASHPSLLELASKAAALLPLDPTLLPRLLWRLDLYAAWFGAPSAARLSWREAACTPPASGGGTGFGDLPGPHALPEGGMEGLVAALHRSAVQERGPRTLLRLGARVVAIDTCGAGAGGCRVTLASGEVFHGLHTVLSVPLPCLAASCSGAAPSPSPSPSPSTQRPPVTPAAIAFTPPLPSWKASVLRKAPIRLSRYKKVFLAWEEPWWPPSWPPFLALCPDTAAGGSAAASPANAALEPRSSSWPFTLVENYAALCGKPILVGICIFGEGGQGGKEEEVPSPTALVQTLLGLLGRSCKSLGELPPPCETLVTSWEKDSLAGCGSFACMPFSSTSPAQSEEERERDSAALARPIPCGAGLAGEAAGRHEGGALAALLEAHGGLYFTGDAFDEEHMGSVHGAIFSGRRVAQDIESVLRNEAPP